MDSRHKGRQRYEAMLNADCLGCTGAVSVRIHDVVLQRLLRLDLATRTATVYPIKLTAPPIHLEISNHVVPLDVGNKLMEHKIAGLAVTYRRSMRVISFEQGVAVRPWMWSMSYGRRRCTAFR
jgi:hypothetical protein